MDKNFFLITLILNIMSGELIKSKEELNQPQQDYFQANALYHVCKQENGSETIEPQSYYLPSYMRLHIQSFCGFDLQKLQSEMHATLHFTFYYGPLPLHIVEKIIQKSILFFSKDKNIRLHEKNKDVIKKINTSNQTVNLKIRKMFHLSIDGNVFYTPFQILNLRFSVEVKSFTIDWPQNDASPIVNINFNLMDLDPKYINMKLSYNDGIQFGSYNLAESLREVEYTNQRLPKSLRQQLKLERNPEQQQQQKLNNIQHFKYAHFNIPFYKSPVSTLTTIFLPLVFLTIINLGIFYQDHILDDRIGNIANTLVAFVALIPTVRQQMPINPKVVLIQILVYIQVSASCICLIQSLIGRNRDQSDSQLSQQYQIILFYLALALAILGFVPIIILTILHYGYWICKYNLLSSQQDQTIFSPRFWDKYNNEQLYYLQLQANRKWYQCLKQPIKKERHYFWKWIQKIKKQSIIKQRIYTYNLKDFTQQKIPLKIATLNFSIVLLSPFQFYSMDDLFYSQCQISRKFIKNIKQDPYLRNRYSRQELQQKIRNEQNIWQISQIDRLYQKQRYCPLYNPDIGIQYNQLLNKQQFEQYWIENWNSIKQSGYSSVKFQNNRELIKRVQTFDWLCYKTLVQVFCEKIASSFEKIIEKNKQSIIQYKYRMKQFFEKQYLSKQKKYDMLKHGLQNQQIDILFLQQVNKQIIKNIPSHKYQVILSYDRMQTSSCAILVNKQLIKSIQTQNSVASMFSLHKNEDLQQYLKGTAITIVNNIVLISCHLGSRSNKLALKRKSALLQLLRKISVIQKKQFIIGINSGCDFICQDTNKRMLIDQQCPKTYVCPDTPDQQPTIKKRRTSIQAQINKAEKFVSQCNDYLLSSYPLNNQRIGTIKGQLSQNIIILPADQHPFDHFLVSANVDVINPFYERRIVQNRI